ncbi:Alkaline phosphatase synthesis transcriptional regulatory protein PhoP [Luteitalea pratensis]|uniref:Alkaline phosphatase synthesis transcriptional regulatory protein PhoP n=1 Tax=Luteitalea pratensis TaxID=1855912 RepID=A0A143PPW1_LUTPR|nr:response regulator transcription factor [Luteitalea pratensis]AMY09864.1 Alkaline phosphatase synthesis transcriptional regulatory protein PhoP [Luteitalea pratensis]
MSRILVVEDDPDIADLLRHYLERASHDVEVLTQGHDAMPRLRERLPDLLILDRMLPGVEGLEICRLVRASPAMADLPVMMVTARAEESDRIVGLELGADDYITKPFSAKEVVARVNALLRRSSRASTASPATQAGRVLSYGDIRMDLEQHVVTVDGRDVRFTAKEFLLLQYFLEHRGRVLSRDLMLTDVWGYQYTGGSRTVDVHVRRLREKVPSLAEAIETVKQFGYKLK